MKHGLGRIAFPDERDKLHLVSAMLRPSARIYRYWNANGWWGNQGATSQCVAYSWVHWLEDGPVTQSGPTPVIPPQQVYGEAQKVDEWPGEDYDGTSVRAGAKVLQAHGYIQSYSWATSVAEVANTVLELGPMVLGTNWYDSMFDPDDAGFLHISGSLAGGHAWVINGVNIKHQLFRMKNSWGRSWGIRGFGFISFADLERLLAEDGEACIAHETTPA